jgi:hypothetical protein
VARPRATTADDYAVDVCRLVVFVGLDADTITPPDGGRAPGWDAGIVVARRAGAAGKDVER